MTLCDASAMIAIALGQGLHATTIATAIRTARLPLVSSEACITEASYLTRMRFGRVVQRRLFDLVASRRSIIILAHQPEDWLRMQDLMSTYEDLPMDFADATLVVLAERHGLNSVLTLDRDFLIYRKRDGSAFTILNQLD